MRALSSLTLVLLCAAFTLIQAYKDCYLYGPSCPSPALDPRFTVYGGTLQGSSLCCNPTDAEDKGILRVCQSCGGDYPHTVGELTCPAKTCGHTLVFDQGCSGSASPLQGNSVAVCSSVPEKRCVFGGASFCNPRTQRGYIQGWIAEGQIIDYDFSKGFYPFTLALCCDLGGN